MFVELFKAAFNRPDQLKIDLIPQNLSYSRRPWEPCLDFQNLRSCRSDWRALSDLGESQAIGTGDG